MKIYEIIITSISLAMDAVSVSICKGLNIKNNIIKQSILLSLSFSIFQMIMPLIGYFLGNSLNIYFMKYNKLIAFILLTIIGINMIRDSFINEEYQNIINLKELIILSFATSIDAFSVGITFSLFKINLFSTIIIIGIITFILCFIGVFIGKYIGNKFKNITSILGGIVLVILGIKFLIEHFHII